jgi:hypothetical protein
MRATDLTVQNQAGITNQGAPQFLNEAPEELITRRTPATVKTRSTANYTVHIGTANYE